MSDAPSKPALWLPSTGVTSFEQLARLSARVQRLFRRHGIHSGDTVLLVEGLGPTLYALVIGALAMGVTVMLVEPWMPVAKIDRVVRTARPRLLVAGTLGLAWAARVPSLRAIRAWTHSRRVHFESHMASVAVEDVDPETIGVVTFTSGTTGNPKGVVRTQGYLLDQYRVLVSSMGLQHARGADLSIFANFVLVNLAQGRPSVIMPPAWKTRDLRRIDHLPWHLQPTTMSTGPGFLIRAMRHARLRRLQHLHVGGALTDAWILEQAMGKWPEAEILHVYGSSEVEPVAIAPARQAVHRSRERGLFQVLLLGKPVEVLRSRWSNDSLWVSGPHVCPMYLGNDEENALHKKRDQDGTIWHDMGDRVVEDQDGWWYAGRSGQPRELFDLEQQVYAAMGHSLSFVVQARDGTLCLVGERLKPRARMLALRFPQIQRLVEAKILRDRRHRARIDRKKTLEKGAPWLLG